MNEAVCYCNHGDHIIALCPLHAAAPVLADAAFHAWVTLGELLGRTDMPHRTEIRTAYVALTEALHQAQVARSKA